MQDRTPDPAMTRRSRWLRALGQKVGIAAALATLAEGLFFGHGLGLNASVFLAAVTLTLLATRPHRELDPAARALSFALIGLAVALALEPGAIAIGLGFLGVTTLGLWLRRAPDGELLVWMGRMMCAWRLPKVVYSDASRWKRHCRVKDFRAIIGSLGDWSIPVLGTSIFAFLFILANPILSSWWDEVSSRLLGFFILDDWVEIARAGFWCAAFAVIWGWLRFNTAGCWAGRRDDRLTFSEDLAQPRTIIRCLVLFNALFALQNILDIQVLFVGVRWVPGLTFAQYAHRGAYPLIVTALLAGAFMFVSFSCGQKAAEDKRARQLVFLWIGQNLVLLFSTIFRLGQYIEAYTLTRWRLATLVWMGLVGFGFFSIATRVRRGHTNGWLIRVNASLVLVVLYTAAFVDIDGAIAHYNVRRYLQDRGSGDRLDLGYMESLGLAALPAVRQMLSQPVHGDDPSRPRIVYPGRLRAYLEHLNTTAQGDVRTWTIRGWLRSGDQGTL